MWGSGLLFWEVKMCIGICAIALQRGGERVVFKSGINSHSEIRMVLGLTDTKEGEQVNLEAIPCGNFSDLSKWIIRVDHDVDCVPRWFLEDKAEIENSFKNFYESEINEIINTKKYSGYLDLRGTGVTVLPDGLSVGGYLDLHGTGVTVLPDKFKNKAII
jgi:hypothetical protein